MMKRNAKANLRSLVIIAVLSLLVIAGFFALTTNFAFVGRKSIHEDAKKYMTRHCLAFYPDSKQGFSFAKDLCKGEKNDTIYDYTLVPYGDYYLVNYGMDRKYFADADFEPVVIDQMSEDGKKIIVDYLRYTYKKEKPDQYYNADFLSKLQLENIDFSNVTYSISEENVLVDLPQYQLQIEVPLKYMQKEIGMNFGFPDEIYRKPVYIDPDPAHPIVCLTFDDGPQLNFDPGESSSEAIVDLLYKYDASGTFYVIGNMMENREIWADYQFYALMKRSINQGNEYGSHTQTHEQALTDLSGSETIRKQIEGPSEYLKDFMGYQMATFRPVEGSFNDEVLKSTTMPAILWDVDSEDWLTRDPEQIVAQVLKYEYDSGDIILFHDIYDETVEALEKILPELINRGCQLLTVSDMLRFYNIEPTSIDYFYSPKYYE